MTEETPRSTGQESNLRAILAAVADGIVVVDESGRVCFANPAAEDMFGVDAGALAGQDFGFPVVSGETTELDLVRRQGGPAVVEMRTVEATWDGRPAFVASLRDVTERMRAEEERAQLAREVAARREAEASLRSKDEFLAVLSHELKTPVTRLRLASQRTLRRVAREGQTPPELRDGLDLVDRESAHLSRIVGQLLDMSRIEDGTLTLQGEKIDLADLVARAIRHVEATRTHGIELRLPRRPLVVMADQRLLDHLVGTLIDNAVRYAPEGGAIEVDLTEEVVEGRRVARLAVRDHGVGIPVEYRDHLFERFYQARSDGYASGLGVGLYVSRRVVELHGGSIAAEFPRDGGTRFVVRLPLA